MITEPIEEPNEELRDPGTFAEAVGAELIAWMYDRADIMTARAVADYERDYAKVERNWKEKRRKFAMPPAPVGVGVDKVAARFVPVPVPGYPKAEPWVLAPEPQWGDEEPDFGPPIPGSDAFYVTGAGGESGDIKERDGKTYKLIVIGERGSIVYVRMWVPIG